MKPQQRAKGDERGFALPFLLLMLLLLLTLSSASLVYTVIDLRSTAHYNTGNRAFFGAEAGILHALGTMNIPGVVNFEDDIVDRWDQLYGPTTKTLPSDPRIAYQVGLAADPANPGGAGTISSTGSAPLEARRSVTALVAKGPFGGAPGAIHIAADDHVVCNFSGNAFEIDGNDHDMFGDLVPGGPVKPGISTRNEKVRDKVVKDLRTRQKDNVQGLGFTLDPLTPSVIPTGGPAVDDLDQVVGHILSLPGVFTTNQNKFNGHNVFGTPAEPQLTHLTNANVQLNGNATGAGVLITDGSITVNGTLDFVGFIIVRGATIINATGHIDDDTIVLGDATILGSLWTGHLDIKVGGSAIVDYCESCLKLADNIGGDQGLLPRPMVVVSWREKL